MSKQSSSTSTLNNQSPSSSTTKSTYDYDHVFRYKWKGELHTLKQKINPTSTSLQILKKLIEKETNVKVIKQKLIGFNVPLAKKKEKEEDIMVSTLLNPKNVKNRVISIALVGNPEEDVIEMNKKTDFVYVLCEQEVEKVEQEIAEAVKNESPNLKQQLRKYDEILMQKLLQLDNNMGPDVDRAARKSLIVRILQNQDRIDSLRKTLN